MRVVRRGVFETNSSSVHSLTIMTQEDYSKWTNDNYLYEGEIFTFEEAKENLKKNKWFDYQEESKDWQEEDWVDSLTDMGYQRKEFYGDDYETYEEFFTTPSGDEMVVFGYFGHD